MSGDLNKFEDYRRERKRRRLDEGPQRDLGSNATVLRELEAQEQVEARNQQLTREVHEFFADATRTAADIVGKVSAEQTVAHDAVLCDEVSEFLQDAIRRVQELSETFRALSAGPEAQRELAANMLNLVGPQLDEFRIEGTAGLKDKHIGLDPTQADGPATEDMPAASLPKTEPAVVAEPEASAGVSQPMVEQHLVAEVASEQEANETASAKPASAEPLELKLFERLRNQPEKLKATLKMMVHSGMLTRDEALEIYRQTR